MDVHRHILYKSNDKRVVLNEQQHLSYKVRFTHGFSN